MTASYHLLARKYSIFTLWGDSPLSSYPVLDHPTQFGHILAQILHSNEDVVRLTPDGFGYGLQRIMVKGRLNDCLLPGRTHPLVGKVKKKTKGTMAATLLQIPRKNHEICREPKTTYESVFQGSH